MNAGKIKLADIFQDGLTLIVPVYQRNYDWREEQCKQLFEDLKETVKESNEHFMGAVVCQDKKLSGEFNEYVIVDGQQRISSVVLFAKALHDSTNDENIKSSLQNKFFKSTNPEYQFKLQPTEYDRAIFKKLMDGNGENFTDAEKKSKIYVAYDCFKKEIAASNIEVSKLKTAIFNLQVVRIVLDGEKPQQIFESLNSTGKDLTETELIRNFLLMDLDSDFQEYLYKEYWLPMERLLKNSDTVETFMFQYLVSKRRTITDMKGKKNIHISKSELYFTFKNYFKKFYSGDKTEQVENFLKDLYSYAQFYSRLIFDNATDFQTLSALEKKFYELIYILKASNSPIILMDLNNRNFDDETFMQMTDALISLAFRAKICRQSTDNAQTAGNILFRLEKNPPIDIDTFWAAITDGNGKYTFPNDEQFKFALTSPEIYLTMKGDICKYLLYKLEKNSVSVQNLPRYKDIYVDYVTPKKLNKIWRDYLTSKNDLNNHEVYLNSLGNLVLTEDSKRNVSFFADKRVKFATSKFYYTRDLKSYSDWTSRQIRRRAEELADIALKVWILPEKYNSPAAVDSNIFTLDSDFRNLKGTKPQILSILKKEETVSSWKEVTQKTLAALYETDSETFTKAAENFISTNANDFRAPAKISENFYVETNNDTKNLLERIKIIVESFDGISGANFKDEIWFTLKNS